MNDKKKFFVNILTGFGGQFIAIALGIIVPRFFITSYGSDVNGLLSTITQIFSYLALLEAGIGQAAKNLLYKPIKEKDEQAVSDIASVAKTYFEKFTLIYALGVISLALALPLVIKTNVGRLTIALIVMFEGLSGVVSFFYIQTPSIIIGVDGKSYINNSINLINKIVGYIVKIVMAAYGLNIVLLQFVFFIVTILKVIFYQAYFKKYYGWVKYKIIGKKLTLTDRNSYVLTEICWTIFSSTDMIVLSTIVSTQLSSVYGIYNMVFSNINILLNSVYMSIVYALGYKFHQDIKEYEKIHDSFGSIFLGIMTVFMSVSVVLTVPFVKLYTRGITDVDYIYPSLPILFGLIQLLSWSRYVSGNLTGLAGYAKQTSYISLIEAVTNVLLSIVFVKKFGIIGVTLATVVALPLKVVWCTYIADKKVMKRSFKKSFSILGVNYLFFFAVVLFTKFFNPNIPSYGAFLIWGIGLSILLGVVGMGLNFLVNKDCWQVVRRYILKR